MDHQPFVDDFPGETMFFLVASLFVYPRVPVSETHIYNIDQTHAATMKDMDHH